MSQWLTRSIVLALVAFAVPARAEPVRLKLAYLFSDRTSLFIDLIKPFVDAVNSEAQGQLAIDVYAGGVLGKAPAQQIQLVLDGTADIAFVIPGSANGFSDNAIVELPGLYRNLREASVVFTRLTAANALRGYDQFHVVGAFATEPESMHMRPRVRSLDDLRDLRIRSSSAIEAAALRKFGMAPVIMPASEAADSISSGLVDGAAVAPALLQEFGIGRVTSYHYMLRTSAGPLMLLMSRAKLDSLPAPAQAIIRRHSGEWAAARFADGYEKLNSQAMERLRSDPRRDVITPTAADLERARVAFRSVIGGWAAQGTHNAGLLRKAEAEVRRFRSELSDR